MTRTTWRGRMLGTVDRPTDGHTCAGRETRAADGPAARTPRGVVTVRSGQHGSMRLTHSAEIPAPIDLVWRVWTDVERWPQWMESMDHVDLASSGGAIEGEPLQLGSKVWIAQPRMANATYEVTELTPGRSWTWVAHSPGTTTTITHELTATGAAATRTDTTVDITGPIGAIAGFAVRKRAQRYLEMEAVGLQAACAVAAG